ncbi:uncharacterized protein TNCT_730021 [Trichonephila clavata]|uniref:Uncharacterized protein n=1 Tax=Trichonephila clavata TaxID=2740835 RepID=A0A8X6KB46_TRICU|nr:uncharacterized protein TNCT_730021 [Trichonephila clavata]
MNYNNFRTSYGLVVKTKYDQVVILERKIPYCMQTFLQYVHKHKLFPDKVEFDAEMCKKFKFNYLPELEESDKIDYKRFLKSGNCEDKVDFPHGQLEKKIKIKINKNPYKLRYFMFLIAYQEFKEETGFRFPFNYQDISKFPLIEVEFEGLNGYIPKSNLKPWNPINTIKFEQFFSSQSCTVDKDCPVDSICFRNQCIQKLVRGGECDTKTGEWVLTNQGNNVMCSCKFPLKVTQKYLGGNCDVDIACGVNGRLQNFDRFSSNVRI